MCKASLCRCIGTKTSEIGVVKWWLSALIQGRSWTGTLSEILSDWSIPCYTEPIYVEEAIASSDFVLCGDFMWIMGEKLW